MTASSFTSSWQSPSNIALVKYWGKKPGQLPANPSISMTLREAVTVTEVKANTRMRIADFGFRKERMLINGEEGHAFGGKLNALLAKMEEDFPVLGDYDFEVTTENTFPHSTGIASSASGLSAFALCILDIALRAEKGSPGEEEFFRKASYYARLGSGSACRSVYGGFTVWGQTPLLENASDDYAIPVNDRIHPSFRDLRDAVLLISSTPKAVASTAGHGAMAAHPFAAGRILQANRNMQDTLAALEKGDLEHLALVTESEALSLHALIMTSEPGAILLEPATLGVIREVRAARRQGIPLFFTIDAGPNVHVLYPAANRKEAETFINDRLAAYCEGSRLIFDGCGTGPQRLAVHPD